MTGAEIIKHLEEQGYNKELIKKALCDGEFLSQYGESEEDTTDAYNLICAEINNNA